MTSSRYITASLRSGLMILAGTALFGLPVALGLGGAVIVTGIVAGVIATGLGIAGTGTAGRGTLPFTAHEVYDRGLAAGLLAAGLMFGIADQPEALAIFAGTGIVQLVIGGFTRYTAAHV
jgi:hypothetical protein